MPPPFRPSEPPAGPTTDTVSAVTQPAAWYPNPSDPSTFRYWDGTAWTEHVAPAVPTHAASIPSGPTTPDGAQLAGWWWRGLALLIDSLLVGVVAQLVSLPAQIGFQSDLTKTMADLENATTPDDMWSGLDAVMASYQSHALGMFLPGVVIGVAYYALMWRFRGATLGKLALGLRIRLRDTPGTLPWASIVARLAVIQVGSLTAFVAFISGSWAVFLAMAAVGSVFGLLDLLWAAWDPKRQALHDKLAKTNVITIR